jgi:phosphate-selective porin
MNSNNRVARGSCALSKVVRNVLLMGGLSCAALPGLVHAGPTVQFGEEGYVTFSYALQMWMQNKDFSSANHSGSSFDTFLRRNRITFMGQYNDEIGFYAQLEAGNDSKYGNDERSVYYRDAYVTMDFQDEMRFIIGRFKNTFSRENLEACLEPLTLDRSVNSYTPFGGSRDTGVAMWGNLADAKFQYRLMVADGREGDNIPKDTPRFTARAHYSFWDPEYDYGYLGTYLGTRKVLTVGVGYDYQPDVAYANSTLRHDSQDYKGVTADIFYEQPTASGTYTLSAAFFDYDVGDAINKDPDATLPVTTQLEANYIKAGYMFPGKIGNGRLQLFARHDTAEYNLINSNLDQKTTGIGANYYIDGQKLKVTLEHSMVKYDKEHPTDHMLQDNAMTTLGVQLIF